MSYRRKRLARAGATLMCQLLALASTLLFFSVDCRDDYDKEQAAKARASKRRQAAPVSAQAGHGGARPAEGCY